MTATANPPRTEIRPGKAGIWIGIALMVAAVVASAVLLALGVRGILGDVDGYDRVNVGETMSLELDPGRYMIFSEELNDPSVEVVGESGPVDLQIPLGNTSFTLDGTEWIALHAFKVDEAGIFEVTNEGPGRIAVGPPIGSRILGVIFIPSLVGLLLGTVGLAVLVVTLVRRGTAKRLQRSAFPGSF